MRNRFILKVEGTLDYIAGRLLLFRKAALRLLARSNRRVLFEFLVFILLVSSVGIAASRWSTTTIASYGNLRIDGVGVYDDSDCSIATAYLDWGTLEPGSIRNITLFIRNEGNHVATIFLAAENWNPVNASDYMQLGWNYGGQMLDLKEVVEVMLILSVSPAVENVHSFSFDVIVGVNE